jgi:hypothetical protein
LTCAGQPQAMAGKNKWSNLRRFRLNSDSAPAANAKEQSCCDPMTPAPASGKA